MPPKNKSLPNGFEFGCKDVSRFLDVEIRTSISILLKVYF